MNFELIVRPDAESDIEEAYEWYEERSKGLGEEFINEVDDCLLRIQTNPNIYSKVYKKTHRGLLKKFPYGIFYIIQRNKVVILGCFHFKRSPKHWKSRAKQK
ncbi:MAG: type II toxin-antitoxin system RelE/ParE family toxin [Ignavibacteria bacterium]